MTNQPPRGHYLSHKLKFGIDIAIEMLYEISISKAQTVFGWLNILELTRNTAWLFKRRHIRAMGKSSKNTLRR